MKKLTNKKAIIYCRVSTKEQDNKYNNLTTQEKACHNWADKNDYKITKTFIENGQSAKTTNRKELHKMINFCKNNKNKIKALIVYKIDRLSRNADDYLSLKVLFNELGVSIYSSTEKTEDSPTAKFLQTITLAFNDYHKQMMRDNILKGLQWKKEQAKNQ